MRECSFMSSINDVSARATELSVRSPGHNGKIPGQTPLPRFDFLLLFLSLFSSLLLMPEQDCKQNWSIRLVKETKQVHSLALTILAFSSKPSSWSRRRQRGLYSSFRGWASRILFEKINYYYYCCCEIFIRFHNAENWKVHVESNWC